MGRCRNIKFCTQVTVWRNRREYHQAYEQGRPTGTLQERPLSNGATGGTQISFRYDPKVFSTDAAYDPAQISKRLRELAFLNAGALLRFSRVQGGERHDERFQYDGGIAEYVGLLVEGTETLHDCIHFSRQSDLCDVRRLVLQCRLRDDASALSMCVHEQRQRY